MQKNHKSFHITSTAQQSHENQFYNAHLLIRGRDGQNDIIHQFTEPLNGGFEMPDVAEWYAMQCAIEWVDQKTAVKRSPMNP